MAAAIGLSSLSCPYKFDRSNEHQSSSVNKSWFFSINNQLEGCAKINEQKRRIKTMEFSSSMRNPPLGLRHQFPSVPSNQTHARFLHSAPLYARKKPRGFGAPPTKKKKTKRSNIVFDDDDDDDDDDEEEEEEERDSGAGVIPEIVTNRMIGRMGITVGIPLFIGLLFFPLFYYLKVVLKIDIANWIPVLVSFIFFGSALLGISYGIVSTSWDPMREGSLLGWNEAQKNWPVFWQSFRGGSPKK